MSYMGFSAIKECARALLEDYESDVKDRPYLIFASICELQTVPDGFVDTMQIVFVVAISPRKRGDDSLLVEDPHPQLIDHDEFGDFLDLASAVLTAVLVRFTPISKLVGGLATFV